MTPKSYRLILSGPLPGARNMALDEALAGGDPPRPTLRLYRWRPWSLSLGYFQRVREEDLLPFLGAGHGVTRRATGGGAIFHAEELTYCLVLPSGDPRIPAGTAASYAWIHRGVAAALAEVGVRAAGRGPGPEGGGEEPFFCFERTASIDLVAGGRKIVGSAQRRTRAAFLQHGSIPLVPNPTAPSATSVAEARGGPLADPFRLEEALVRGFEEVLGAAAEPGTPEAEEEARAARLEAERYGNPAWVIRPWRGPGRPAAPPEGLPVPPPPAEGGPAPLRVLRAAVGAEALRVLGAVGGGRPSLPHGRLRAAEAARVTRLRLRALSADRDPWDSTFRRSPFADRPEGTGPEGSPPERRLVAEADTLVALLYGDPEAVLLLDARRFNYGDLGGDRTGRWEEDGRRWLRALLGRAPAAAAGPGARALLEGRPAPALPGEEALLAAARDAARGGGATPGNALQP